MTPPSGRSRRASNGFSRESRPSRLTLSASLSPSITTKTLPFRQHTMRLASNPSSSRRTTKGNLVGPSGSIRLGLLCNMTPSSSTTKGWLSAASPGLITSTRPTIHPIRPLLRRLSSCPRSIRLIDPLSRHSLPRQTRSRKPQRRTWRTRTEMTIPNIICRNMPVAII